MDAPLCLLTRPEAQSRAFAAELPGIEVLIAPILRIAPVDFDPARAEAAVGFVFTSANAVPFAGAARGRPALCVGAQTHLHGRHRARELPVPGMAVYDQIAEPLTAVANDAIMAARPLILPIFSPRSAVLLSEALADALAPVTAVAISDWADAAYTGPAMARFVAPQPGRAGMAQVILSLIGTERTGLRWVETERGGR